MIRRATLLLIAAIGATGCGSGAQPLPHLAELTRKCRESQAAITSNVQASLREAETRGLRGSSAELANALATEATYIEGTKERPDCKLLLRAMVFFGNGPKGAAGNPFTFRTGTTTSRRLEHLVPIGPPHTTTLTTR